MRRIPPDELATDLRIWLTLIPSRVRRLWTSKRQDERDRATDAIAAELALRLARFEVRGPEPLAPHSAPMPNHCGWRPRSDDEQR